MQMERLLTMIGIGAAVLIVVVVIVIAAKLIGIFNLGSGSRSIRRRPLKLLSDASESESGINGVQGSASGRHDGGWRRRQHWKSSR